MNTSLLLPSDQLTALRVEDIQLYLASRGWRPTTPSTYEKGIEYTHSDHPDAEVLVPQTKELADYSYRMADIVQMLAAVESRSAWEVVSDLSGPPADILRLRVSGSEATLGQLPLDEGIQIVQRARTLLLATACSVHHARAHHPRLTNSEAVEFLQTCLLGQTERSGFVVKILIPMPPQLDSQSTSDNGNEANLPENQPFARRVTLRLMSAMGFISGVLQRGSFDEIMEGVAVGVSANLCEALASMMPKGEQAVLQVQMSWSRNRSPVPETVPTSVSFSQAALPIIAEAGRQLREQASTERRRIEGIVVGLKAKPSTQNGFEGNVLLRTVIAGSPSTVSVTLPHEEYISVCDAHRDGKRVAIRGLLLRGPKMFRLLEPDTVQILTSGS